MAKNALMIDPHTGQPVDWTQAQGPSLTYGGIDPKMMALYQQAGLWRPEYANAVSDWGTDPSSRAQARQQWEGSPEYQQLQQSLAGWTQGQARKDYSVFDMLQSPDGQTYQQASMNKGPSFHKDDYANMATVMLGGAGAALGGAAGVGSSLYGMSGAAGAAAGGATLGAAGGAIQAYGNDQNVLKGAVMGGLVGGAGGYLSGGTGAVSGMDLAADGAASGGNAYGSWGAGSGGLGDASFNLPSNSFNLDPNGVGGGVQFGAPDINPNTLANGGGNLALDFNTDLVNRVPDGFGGFQYTSGETPLDQYTDNSQLPRGSYNELGADGTSQVVDTNTWAPQSSGGSSLADFFSGNGNMNDYLRTVQALYGLYNQNKATGAAQDGNNRQMDLLTRMYEENKAQNQPLVDVRNSVLPQIQGLLKDPSSIANQPDYQFGLKQGMNQLNNRAAASGNYYSGAQMKAAQQFGQDYAGTKLDQSLNRLMGVATGTQVGANNNQQNSNNFGVSGGNALQQGGNIRAGGYLGQQATVNNGINGWLQDQYDRKYWGGGP
jgi:hypothetical protein